MRTRFFRSLLILLLTAVAFLPAQAAPWQGKVSPQVLNALAQGETEFLVVMEQQADLSAAAALPTKLAKGEYVFKTLTEFAARTQPGVLAVLENAGVKYQAFWIANLIWARGDAQIVQQLASRSDVAFIAANPAVPVDLLPEAPVLDLQGPNAIEWNILKTNADDVWAAGFEGQGVVIGGQDTGYDWDHPALINQYRGWNGGFANHDYDWHDAIHETGSSCGANSPVPCDDHGHGTHTMGTMVGDDGGSNQIGMAPGARWIGCRNMNSGVGTPTTYTECFQWFVAPTRVDGTNPLPTMAPDVISNSWGCPPDEGCDLAAIQAMQIVVENVRAAGIVVVVSAGNNGSSCNTVDDPPAIYDASFSVGSTDSSDNISSFSSRGPADYTGLPKPDISAPGSSIRSSLPGTGYGSMSGTSMASPHVAGDVALLFSAFPELIGQVDVVEDLIRYSAMPRTAGQTCGGVPGSQIPNNTYGWGRIDAWAAYQLAQNRTLTINKQGPAVVNPGQAITYTLSASYEGFLSTHDVVLTDTLPLHTSLVTATLPHTFVDGLITWDLGDLAGGASAEVTLVVQPDEDAMGNVVNDSYGVQSADVPGSGGPAVVTQIMETWGLSKLAPAQVAYGLPITYTLTVTNESDIAPTSSLVLSDTIPANTTFITATLPYTMDGNVVEWSLGSLPANDSRTVTLVVQPDAAAGGEIVNEFYGVRSLEVIQTVSGAPVVTRILDTLSLSKQAPTLVAPGAWITYTLTITNNHVSQATLPLVLTDTLPTGTTFVAASLSYTMTGDVVTWNFASLAPSQVVNVTLTVQAPPTAGVVTNSAYGLRTEDYAIVIDGKPVSTWVLLRIFLPLMMK